MTEPVRWNGKAIFKKRDGPACDDDEPKRSFRWPYQANVMKIFDIANRAMGRMDCGII